MNTYQSSALIKAPMRLWRRFQLWRAMRIYTRVVLMGEEAIRLAAKADRLIGKNVKPPMPLFDHDEAQRARNADGQ